MLSSQTIDALPDEAWASTVDHVSVFAGMTPEHNLRLVEALQYRGHVVAITGAGSRDAPALHQADIGMAMGMNGTGVAKAAANLVLTDDSFVTIQAAIAEGRSVCDNIIKAMIWTLPTNFAAGLVIVMATLFGSPLPITPLQVLWINTVTAVLLGSTLMVEPKEPGIMQRSPVPPRAPSLTLLGSVASGWRACSWLDYPWLPTAQPSNRGTQFTLLKPLLSMG